MKTTLYFRDGVINLPAGILPHLPRADGESLRVLISLADAPSATREETAARTGLSPEAVDRAIAFWRGAGILELRDAESSPGTTIPPTDQADSSLPAPAPDHITTAPVIPPQKADSRVAERAKEVKPRTRDKKSVGNVTVRRSSEDVTPEGTLPPEPNTLPKYTTEELKALMEKRRDLSAFLGECSNAFGKIFNTHEVNLILSLIDYLHLEDGYLLLLLAYCKKIGKRSLHYVQSLAFSLYDDGVTDIAALQECLKRREAAEEAEGKIRTLFGMKSRALTAKERKMIDTWINTYRYGQDVITRAYEITVDAIGEASVPYANSIMERWSASGLHTLAEIEASEAARRTKTVSPAMPGVSFDTNDFFDAALQRSFGDDYRPSRGEKKTP